MAGVSISRRRYYVFISDDENDKHGPPALYSQVYMLLCIPELHYITLFHHRRVYSKSRLVIPTNWIIHRDLLPGVVVETACSGGGLSDGHSAAR